MFIAALFTIAKYWKQPKCPSLVEWVKQQWYNLNNGILHSIEKEETPSFCNSIDGTGEYYAKWNKPVGERQIPYDLTYMKNVMKK